MRRAHHHSFFAVSLLALVLAAGSVACGGPTDGAGGPSDGGESTTDGTASGSAGSAGKETGKGGEASAGQGNGGGTAEPDPELNAGEYTAAAFGYQEAEPAGFNPLGKARFNLLRLEETAFVLNGGDGGYQLDDAQHGLARSAYQTALAPITEQAVWAGSGNLDADGNAELVVVSRGASAVTVTMGDNAGKSPLGTTKSFTVPHGGAEAGAIKAALGDFDGDGKAEIALAVSAGQAGWVRVYDDADAGFGLIKEVSSRASGHGDYDLTSGNFDGDEQAELALLKLGSGTDDVSLSVLDDAQSGFAELSQLPASALLPKPGMGSDKSKWHSGGIVRAGNVDGDAQDELYVFLTQQDFGPDGSSPIIQSRLYDDAGKTPQLVAEPGKFSELKYAQRSNERPLDAAFADLDGDGVDEIYWMHLGSDKNTFAWYLSQWRPSANGPTWNQNVSYEKLDTAYNADALGRLTVISGDELAGETLVLAMKNTGTDSPLRTLRITGQGSTQANDVHQSFALDVPAIETTTIDYPSSSVPLVVGGDFDNDNLQVRYTGNRWQSLASPRPLAVLSAPPLNAAMGQGEEDSGTAFGKEAMRGSASTDEIGASYGTTMSFDSSSLTDLLGGPLGGLASASVSSSLERAFSSSKTTTTLVTTGTSYAAAYPDDCIVFQGVLHMSYEYEVTTASDAALLGHKLTIDVPVAAKTYKWTLDFYNEKLAPGDVRIGAETLSHVVGDPSSYPSAAERDALLGQYAGWKSDQVAVGQGNGTNSVSISLENEVTNASTNTITNDDSWGVAVAGFGYSESRAVTGTTVYEVTVGAATNYEGVVGDIRSKTDYRERSYDFGLFVYQYQHPQGPRFQVVNYWTSNLGPAFK